MVNHMSIKGTLKPNLKVISLPILSFVLLIFLINLVFTRGYKLVSLKVSDIKEGEKIERALSEKVMVLRKIEGVVLGQADTSVAALPDKNPSLLAISQLTRAANDNFLKVVEKKGGAEISGTGEIKEGRVTISVEGGFQDTLAFLKNILTLAPLSVVSEVKIKSQIDHFTAQVSVSIFWSSFPTTLPALTSPIKTLTPEEEKFLGELAALIKPSLLGVPPSTFGGRPDPFN